MQSSAFSGFVVNHGSQQDDASAGFAQGKIQRLPGGYVAVPIVLIRRENQVYTDAERTLAHQTLNNNWEAKTNAPANAAALQLPARCVDVTVDNIVIRYTREMAARGLTPQIIMGRWTKTLTDPYGNKRQEDGIVIAGGGHYERCGRKSMPPGLSAYPIKFEEGDMSLRLAADKELKEEIGIDPSKVKITKDLGVMDDVFSDPRKHILRYVFVRWVEEDPRPSEELKNVIAVPLEYVGPFCERKISWPARQSDGTTKNLGLILNHDKLLTLVFALEGFQTFIAEMKRVCAPVPAAAGFGGWAVQQ